MLLHRLLFGFMLATWFLSMWISNTATTAMMVPVVEAVLQQMKETHRTSKMAAKQALSDEAKDTTESAELEQSLVGGPDFPSGGTLWAGEFVGEGWGVFHHHLVRCLCFQMVDEKRSEEGTCNGQASIEIEFNEK